MAITEKDKVFLALLPALAVAAAYVFLFAQPTLKQTVRLEARLTSLGTEKDILARREKLAADQARLRDRLAALEARAAAEPGEAGVAPAGCAAGLSRLEALSRKNGIRMLSAAPAERPHMSTSKAQEALLKAGVAQPQAWTVTVEATYDALAGLLDDFARSSLPIIPETLSMHPGTGEGKPNYWTLSLCL